jgi:hypothetical protein
MVAGCTFLITFDDVPGALEGGADTSAPIGPPDVRIDGNGAGPDGAADAGPDVRDAIANPEACKRNLDGKYCGGDQISWPGSKDDLVTCKGGVVQNVKFCATGIGCIRMLNGYPDQCDECATKTDGTYCGRDMPGWDAVNANFRVRCQNRAEVGLLLCNAAGCGSNGAASACK